MVKIIVILILILIALGVFFSPKPDGSGGITPGLEIYSCNCFGFHRSTLTFPLRNQCYGIPYACKSHGIFTSTPVQNSSCKKEGESICINPVTCPNNNDKCCKDLLAVIETKSGVICQVNSAENSTKPRVTDLEQ